MTTNGAIFLGLVYGEQRCVGYPSDWAKIEVGPRLFAYDPSLECPDCDGCGCRSCKFTGFTGGREPDWDTVAGGPER